MFPVREVPGRRQGWYYRLQAWALARGSHYYEGRVDPYKRRLFGPLRGRVIEIGPGAGASFAYLDPSVRWLGIEPNLHNHPHLVRRAAERGLTIELQAGLADRLPAADGAVDHVISSLVLCTVPDPPAVLAEIRRVLRPGGTLVFLEHVVAHDAGRAGRQRWIKPLWRRLMDGCEPDRDTEAVIRGAGFRAVEVERFDVRVPIAGPHIAGRAIA